MNSLNLERIGIVKKTYNFAIKLLFLMLVIAILFGLIPESQAQSVQEWSEPVNLSMSGAAFKPSMVVDSEGVIHVIWVDLFDGFKYAQSADGVTWTAPESVNFPFSAEAEPPVMLRDASGLIHIFWLDNQNKLNYAQTLNGNLATPPGWRRKASVDSQVFDYDASLDPQGGVHIAYVKNPAPVPGTAGVFYRRLAAGAGAFTGTTLLYESAYFRSLTAENAHIRLAVSGDPGLESIHVIWDDRLQKRIFIVTSVDGGLNWGPVKEMLAPQENLGFRTPYGADIDTLEDKILVTWLVGEPGSSCTPYSWSSSDGGETWGEQVPILSESAQCPTGSEFIPIEPGYTSALFRIQGDLSLSAWNGEKWSNPEIQTGLSSISNPATFDQVLLGCEQAATYDSRLFIVGCDEGTGHDIWFITRQLDPLDSLFPLPSDWRGDSTLTTAPRTLDALSSVTDSTGNVHAVWIQSPGSPRDTFPSRIEYASWNGTSWNRPSPIITNLGGTPKNLALQIDSQQRLLLSWVNPQTGELMYTWSSSERANLPLEWAPPTILSNMSKLTSSPDMLVDAADRITIAYAVTLNEGRGIYLIQSSDLGQTWSAPVTIFDAVTEDWEMVDQPRLAVSANGMLHLLLTRYTLSQGEPQPAGLYYSRSEDGGSTWTPVETVSEQPVQWSEIVAYQDTVHRIWQEKSRLVALTNHQTSTDGGFTWSSSVRIPTDAVIDARPAVSMGWDGTVHLLQVTGEDIQNLQEWELAGARWQLLETRKVSASELREPVSVDSGVTSDGSIYALMRFVSESASSAGMQTSILGIHRSLSLTGPEQPFLATISTPSAPLLSASTPDLEASPSVTQPPLGALADAEQGSSRNIIGVILITTVVLFLLVFTLPRRRKDLDDSGHSKK